MNKSFLDMITLNKVLIGIIIFLAFMIISGSIIVKSRPEQKTIVVARGANTISDKKQSDFRKLGTIRALTKADAKTQGVTLVIKPILSYDSGDQDFFEELSRKNQSIKEIFTDYFNSKTKEELNSLGEKNIKNELKDRINQNMSLNKIQEIYFEDYIFLD